jgi:hypothetical protein
MHHFVMYLQLEAISLLIVALAVLGLIIFFISRRGSPPPAEPEVRYTPGEQEILRQLDELKERVDKMIPPYGRVGYIPSSIEELKELFGFTYVKLGEREIGERPSGLEKVEDLDVDFLQARLGDNYVYVVKRGEKKLTAAGSQYLDYLTVRFLLEFLDYI